MRLGHVGQVKLRADLDVQSGITEDFPGIDLATANMEIFSRPVDGKTLPLPRVYQLQPRDRVEIYRPLVIDPKQARLARAAKAKAARSEGK